MLKTNGESRHPCLVCDLRGKAFSLSPWSMMLLVGFVHVLYHVKKVPFYMQFYWLLLPWMIFWILLNAFSAFIKMLMCFLPFLKLIYYITLILICWTSPPSLESVSLGCDIYIVSNTMLNLVCYYFVEDFCIYIQKRYWSIVFFFCDYFGQVLVL